MKNILLALLAASSLAVAAPALAHGDGDDDNDSAAWSAQSYGDFSGLYQHIWQGIQHGVGDGSYTNYQARRFYRELQRIRYRADWEERTGRYDPEDIQYRLQRLHDIMHVAHERGHERLDREGDWAYPR